MRCRRSGSTDVLRTARLQLGRPALRARTCAQSVSTSSKAASTSVVPSGSCAGMIRAHYPDLFRDEPRELTRALALCERTYELADFLANVAKIDAVPGTFHGTITYHDACSGLRELGVKSQPRALLAKTEGLKLIEMNSPEQCCGFGGTFSVKFGDISIAHRRPQVCGHRRDRRRRGVLGISDACSTSKAGYAGVERLVRGCCTSPRFSLEHRMSEPMKIAVMGSGGVGGLFGGRLATVGADVHFVARGGHLAAMRENGLTIESDAHGTLHVPQVNVTDDPATIGVADFVLIAVKLWDTEAAGRAVRASWATYGRTLTSKWRHQGRHT